MYTILINNDNSMTATVKTAIMQRSKLVDNLLFLCPKMYGEHDMSTYNCVFLEYLSPISKTYHTEELVLQEELYKDHLQYILPVDTNITAEAGEIKLALTFVKVEMDAETEKPVPRVRKVNGHTIRVIPTSNWAQFIPDKALTVIDQRIAKLVALQQGSDSSGGDGGSSDGSGDSTVDTTGLINDNLISRETTYSSQKIEDEFISDDELDESVKNSLADNVITTDTILILDGGTASGD